MKPRLTVALTSEDFWIWDRVVSRCGGNGIAHHAAPILADRRDALLMLCDMLDGVIDIWFEDQNGVFSDFVCHRLRAGETPPSGRALEFFNWSRLL